MKKTEKKEPCWEPSKRTELNGRGPGREWWSFRGGVILDDDQF